MTRYVLSVFTATRLMQALLHSGVLQDTSLVYLKYCRPELLKRFKPSVMLHRIDWSTISASRRTEGSSYSGSSSLRTLNRCTLMVKALRLLAKFGKYTGIHKRMVWLLLQLNTNYDDYILQLDGAPPHFHRNVRVLLNRVLQQRWIGRAAKGDIHLFPWPPCSPDLTPCSFFLWGFVNLLAPEFYI